MAAWQIQGGIMQKRHLLTLAVALLAGTVLGGNAMAQDKKELAFVVNGASDFWKSAEAGVKKAQGELPNYDLQFKYPEQAAAADPAAADGRSGGGRRRRASWSAPSTRRPRPRR